MRIASVVVILALLISGCREKPDMDKDGCKIPEVIELRKFASSHGLHVRVIFVYGDGFHVRLWPYSEGYEPTDFAYTGVDDTLDGAISLAKDSFLARSETRYKLKKPQPDVVLCEQ